MTRRGLPRTAFDQDRTAGHTTTGLPGIAYDQDRTGLSGTACDQAGTVWDCL